MCLSGVFLGTLVGVLPGFGPVAAMAILLPLTFKMPAVTSMIILTGIFYGAMYGGSTTSILVNIPGETASVITCLDGYQMAKQGRAGPALGIAAFGSFIAGTFGIIMLMFVTPPLAEIGLKFGYPEIFGLILVGLVMISFLASGSKVKTFMMAALGMMIGMIGLDPMRGTGRFTYGIATLMGGVGVIPVAMGIFGIPEVLENIELSIGRELVGGKIRGLLPTRKDWKESSRPIARGSLLGFFLGTLPGIGPVIPAFLSYALEKRLSKHPEKFGTGMIAGVAGPESANNAATTGCMVPLMGLGIPPVPSMAILMGALMIQGVQVGPFFIKQHPEIFWGVIASLYIGNIMLLILNLPLIGLWVKVLKVPYWVLAPLILLFCLVGSYSAEGYIFDCLLVVLFGIVGYLMRKFRYEPAPFILAFVLGSMLEVSFRQSLIYSHGDLLIFFRRPLSATFTVLALLVIAINFVGIKKRITNERQSPAFGQFYSALVLLVLAIIFFFQATHYRIGSLRTPEPGFFPVVLSSILGLLALVCLLRVAIKKKTRLVKNPWVGLGWPKTIYVLASLILYVPFFGAAGFLLSTFLLMVSLFIIGKPERWFIGILGAILSSGMTYLIFKILLGIQFPAGIIEDLLGLT
jgi:putative tricarboxylic transport membrane protein